MKKRKKKSKVYFGTPVHEAIIRYNHSDDPTCVVLNGFWHQIPVKYLVTKKDIKKDEELTARYSLYVVEDDQWE